MTSMTGYGYNEMNYETAIVSVEIKSVNSRFLDLNINLPPFLNSIESYFRNKISQNITRGKVDVFIRVKELESDAQIYADTKMAKSYYDAIKEVAIATGYDEKSIPLSLILEQNGVLNSNKSYDVEKYQSMIDPIFDNALNQFVKDANREGENLLVDLKSKLLELETCADFFKKWQPKMENAFKESILKKFNELLADKVDEQRVMTEVAALMVKYTINEEIVRLKSHINALTKEIEENPIPGKRIDFICQEMNREINTIGSKNQFIEIAQEVINAKDALENIREQSKNIE